MAVMLVVLQVATIIAPPDPATAASTNDIIRGGIAKNGNPKKTLVNIYSTNKEVKAIFNYYGITRSDLEKTKNGTLNSNDRRLKSLGRNPHSTKDKKVRIGGKTYYIRPLYTWGDNVTYKALEGRRKIDNKYFAVLYDCGNLVVVDTTPEKPKPEATPPKPTAPVKTPPATPAPAAPAPVTPVTPAATIPETPVEVPVTQADQPDITIGKSAVIIGSDGSQRPANGAVAQPGESIEYTLTTTNKGKAVARDYVVTENVQDILEYADLTKTGGGILFDGLLTWPKTSIQPGRSYITIFQVRVKSPLPTRPASSSDPESFDLKMDNVYGNLVSVNLAVPVEKQVEVATETLPETGSGLNTFIVFLIFSGVTYFYFRNRQMVTEVSMLKGEYNGDGDKA